MSASVPSIPPRPMRSQKEHRSAGPGQEAPMVPPRPARRTDRSTSPHRDSFARSPLNESTFALNGGGGIIQNMALHMDARGSTPPPDESSVKLPSIGQEGTEYAAFYERPALQPAGWLEPNLASAPETRNVVKDLELHAPKPALPTSSAKARIATVTRTDSSQAAAMGIGKPTHDDDRDPHMRSLKPRASFASEHSQVSVERTGSVQPSETEHGIPEIGQRVPMYPNAGDVQAPSPAPFAHAGITSAPGLVGEGQHRSGRHHGRTRSGREHFHPPPGSYGLHGHGTPIYDKFEKAWYEKHPDVLEHEEHGEYGPGIGRGRGEFALSREELDRLVRETASRGAGVGTSPAVLGTPHEEIGYIASEEYAAKLASSRPASTFQHLHAASDASETHTRSALRKESFPTDLGQEAKLGDDEWGRPQSARYESDAAVESAEEDDVIHIDEPSRRTDKIGGGGYDPPTEDLGQHGGNTADEGGWIDERGYGVPILASDEVAKEPGAEHLHPAISPPLERSASEVHGAWDSEPHSAHSAHSNEFGPTTSRGSSVSGSRANSRPTSMSGLSLGFGRHMTIEEREELGTPLEDVAEYEPLFPDDEEEGSGKGPGKKAFPVRPKSLLKHKFPSQDIWEDAPLSAQLQATISTPALLEDDARTVVADKDDESEPTRGGPPGPKAEADASSSGRNHGMQPPKPQFKADVLDDISGRPNMKQRFPSRDIWEDTPASLQLQAVVSTPQAAEAEKPLDRAEGVALDRAVKPDSGAEPSKEHPAGGEAQAESGTSSAAEKAGPPAIPARPARTKKAAPTEAPVQPSIPPRPTRRMQSPSKATSEAAAASSKQPESESSPTRQTDSPTESGAAAGVSSGKPQPTPPSSGSERKAPMPPERPKPQVPVRPVKPAPASDGNDGAPLVKTTSAATKMSTGGGSDDGASPTGAAVPMAPKPKPAIPARPNGSKIASLKAGFMSDLDKRLQLGPRGVKPPEKAVDQVEPEKERAPLTDARKERARGPARRRPGTSPSGPAAQETRDEEQQPSSTFELTTPRTLWQIADDGRLDVAGDQHDASSSSPQPQPPSSEGKVGGGHRLATDTAAGETFDETREVPSTAGHTSTDMDPTTKRAESGAGLSTTGPTDEEDVADRAESGQDAA